MAAVLGVSQVSNFGLSNELLDQYYGTIGGHHMPIFLCTFTPIVLGVLVAHVLHHRCSFRWASHLLAKDWALPMAIATILVATQVTLLGVEFQGAPRLAVHLAMALLLGALVCHPCGWATLFLEVRPLAWIGSVSYGIYLYHVLVLEFQTRSIAGLGLDLPSRFVMFPVVLSITALLAWLSYRFIEAPLLGMRPRRSSGPNSSA
jgi:peptidoglycan/LPS O-acetylase OafA/YrhL